MQRGLHPALLAAYLLTALIAYYWMAPDQPEQADEAPGDAALLELQGATMGTGYSIRIPAAGPPPDREGLAADIRRLLERLDQEIFSTYEPGSQLSRFNRAPVSTAFQASPELLEVVALAREIHTLSGGAFDMTIGPLVDLWGFGPAGAAGAIPDEQAIAAARGRLDSGAVRLLDDPPALLKEEPVQLDLSGIAKGYAVDAVAEMLEQWGVTDYLVEVGGELKAKGSRPSGEPWRIAVEAPEPGLRRPFEIFTTDGGPIAAAGAGDYRQYFEREGRRFSHELDPRTGRPIDHALTAVTVIAPSAARADALATALMVLGPEEGTRLSEEEGIAAFFILRTDQGFESSYTETFRPYLETVP